MDPWIGENEEYVKDICEKLVANETSAELEICFLRHPSDEEWSVVANAIKRNTTVEKLQITSDEELLVMSVSAAFSLAGAVRVHTVPLSSSFNFHLQRSSNSTPLHLP